MRQVVVSAPAKLNLTLDILRRREDGYHDLEMVMQSISLCDIVTVKADTGAGAITLRLPDSDLPAGPENLAYRAAQLFFNALGVENTGVEITLEKRIPAQAGMAGGSTDSAAVLRALRTLYCPTVSTETLERIGQQAGSDVPYCVRGGTALAEGRGERLTTLPGLPDCCIVVCKPEFGLSTPTLFGRVRVDQIRRRPDASAMRGALEAGDLPRIGALLCNVFEEFLAPEESREIAGIRETLGRCGALGSAMSGSGPTVFGLFSGETAAKAAVSALQKQYRQVFLTHPL